MSLFHKVTALLSSDSLKELSSYNKCEAYSPLLMAPFVPTLRRSTDCWLQRYRQSFHFKEVSNENVSSSCHCVQRLDLCSGL